MPAGNDFVAIAAGTNHNLALKSDGSLAGWGWGISGQSDVPAGNIFVAIAGGHSLAILQEVPEPGSLALRTLVLACLGVRSRPQVLLNRQQDSSLWVS